MRQKALVIIDMQPIFEAAKKIIPNVVRAIENAKRRKFQIVLVEYHGSGISHLKIRQALKGYPYDRVFKDQNDGSLEIIDALGRRQTEVYLCGVNTGACVHETASGLSRYKNIKKLKLIKHACNDEWGHNSSLKRIQRLKKIKLIHNR